MNSISEKYPALEKEILFKEISENERVIILSNGSTESISDDGFAVYRLCNGELSSNEIFDILQKDYDLDFVDLEKFLLKAFEKKIVSLSDQKNPQGLSIDDKHHHFPLSVSFQPTNTCNLMCSYCYGSYGPKTTETMTLLDIELLFSYLKSINVQMIEITGGEPLTHPNFYEILKLSFLHFKYTAILSNGVLFNEKIIKLLEENKRRVGVQVSIDGFSVETNDKVRGVRNTWPRTLENLKKLSSIGIPLRIGYVITNDNYNELDETVSLMRKIGVTDIVFTLTEGIGRGKDIKYPDSKSLTNVDSPHFDQIKANLTNVTLNNDDIVFSIKRIKNFEHHNSTPLNCGAGHRSVTILPSGDFIPCAIMNDSKNVLGNIFDKNSISSYFNPSNNKYQFFKRFKKNPIDDKCLNCEHINYCGSCLMRILKVNNEENHWGGDLCPFLKSMEMDNTIKSFINPLILQK